MLAMTMQRRLQEALWPHAMQKGTGYSEAVVRSSLSGHMLLLCKAVGTCLHQAGACLAS